MIFVVTGGLLDIQYDTENDIAAPFAGSSVNRISSYCCSWANESWARNEMSGVSICRHCMMSNLSVEGGGLRSIRSGSSLCDVQCPHSLGACGISEARKEEE